MTRRLSFFVLVTLALGCTDQPLEPVDSPLFAKNQGIACPLVVDVNPTQRRLDGKKFRIGGEARLVCDNGTEIFAARGPAAIQGKIGGNPANPPVPFDRGIGRGTVNGLVSGAADFPGTGFQTALYGSDAEWAAFVQQLVDAGIGTPLESRIRVRDYAGFFTDFDNRLMDGAAQVFADGFESGDTAN